ncbi:hypothetical protein W7U_12805 [Mycobacterium sp. H4Y]|nr:hypothetical protein W7U_12805 [Mycobacterium sp. H4Y]
MMNTDELVGQLLLWSDLRYVTLEDFEAYVAQQEAVNAELRARVTELEARVSELERLV